jgi:hypothetical protein
VIGWLLVAALAFGHEPGECPPAPLLRTRVERAPLPAPLRRCVEEATTSELERIALLDRLQRAPVEAAGEVQALLPGETDPDDTLLMGELLAEAAPEVAWEAVARTWALTATWAGPVDRARKLSRLLALQARLDPERAVSWARGLAYLGVTGEELVRARAACAAVAAPEPCATPEPPPAMPPRAPSPDELSNCADLGRMWTRAWWGAVYATDRNCLVRATDVLAPPARGTAARLALQLALRHRNREEALIVAHRVASVLSGDPAVARHVAALHRELGDDAGAHLWEQRVAGETTPRRDPR